LFLTPKRKLEFIMGMGRDSLISVARQGLLLFPDLDYHEKQLWASCLRLAGVDASGIVNSDILEELAKAEPAAAQYWKFCRFFIQIFISDEPLLCKIEMAGRVLGYLATWRWYIRNGRGRGLTFTRNFFPTKRSSTL